MNTESHDYEALAGKLAEVLADTKVLAAVVQGFHWNVKGPDFAEYHELFQEIYEDIDSAIDPTAENILKVGFDTPYLLQDFLSLTSIQAVRVRRNDPETMVGQLVQHNAQIIKCLNEAFHAANHCDEQGVADFLAGRIDMHKKWQWQLAASLGLSVRDVVSYAPAPVAMPIEEVVEPAMEEIIPEAYDEGFDDLAEFRG